MFHPITTTLSCFVFGPLTDQLTRYRRRRPKGDDDGQRGEDPQRRGRRRRRRLGPHL